MRGISLTPRGQRLVAACPIHRGDNPAAFVVHPGRNLWYCFTGCARGGNVIDLVCLLDHCSYPHAAQTLESIAAAGVHGTAQGLYPTANPKPWRPYTRTLPLDADDPWLRRKGIHPATALRYQVGRYHGPGFLAGCIGVRLHNPAGHPLGYAGRRLSAEDVARHGKWKLPPGLPKGSLLYGHHLNPRPSPVIPLAIVECPWGVLRLAQLHVPAVALLGTKLTPRQLQALGPPRPLGLLLDGDPAGRAASHRLATALRDQHHHVTILDLPDGADPDDLSDSDLDAILATWR
jgi:DNA primase